jgi:hypothetical protein
MRRRIMKPFLYLFVFGLIIAGISFAFLSMTAPTVPQETVTRTLDAKDAFAPTPAP